MEQTTPISNYLMATQMVQMCTVCTKIGITPVIECNLIRHQMSLVNFSLSNFDTFNSCRLSFMRTSLSARSWRFCVSSPRATFTMTTCVQCWISAWIRHPSLPGRVRQPSLPGRVISYHQFLVQCKSLVAKKNIWSIAHVIASQSTSHVTSCLKSRFAKECACIKPSDLQSIIETIWVRALFFDSHIMYGVRLGISNKSEDCRQVKMK